MLNNLIEGAAMMRQWHISVDGRQSGPFPEHELRQMIGAGRLRGTDQVWSEGLPTWMVAESVPGLFPPVAARQPPPVPPAARTPPPLPGHGLGPPVTDDPLAFLADVDRRPKPREPQEYPQPTQQPLRSEAATVLLKGLAFVLSIPIGVTAGVIVYQTLFPNAHGALPSGFAVACCYFSFNALKSAFHVA